MAILVIGDDKTKAIPVLEKGGSTPVVSPLDVTPSTSAQQFIPSGGTDGYNPVNVAAVTNAIDNHITPNNIVNGVTILGVTGTAPKMINGLRILNQNGVYNIVNTTTNTFQSQVSILVTPTETINITQDGTYNVANYGTAIVNTSGAPSGSPYITFETRDMSIDSGGDPDLEDALSSLIDALEKIEVYYFSDGNNDYAYIFPVFYAPHSQILPIDDGLLDGLYFNFVSSQLQDLGAEYSVYLGFMFDGREGFVRGGIEAYAIKE